MSVHFSQNQLNQLQIIIDDNGPGIKNSVINSIGQDVTHKSLGLEIIQNRINLINETNPTIDSSMTFINKSQLDKNESGLKVIFILPEKYKLE